ncbi:exported hypothetical protein [Gammaproteobacteria bacterium]
MPPPLKPFPLLMLLGLTGSSALMANSLDQAALAESHGHDAPASAHVVAKHAKPHKAAKKAKPSPSSSQFQQQLRAKDEEIHSLRARMAELEAHRPILPPIRLPQPLSSEQFTAPIAYP